MSGIIAQNTLDNTGLIKSPEGGGAWNFISKVTASSSATVSFTSGIDSTYKEYLFTFKNLHPSAKANFQLQGSTDSGSSYGVAITSTHFQAKVDEANTASADFTYEAGRDLAQSTSFQNLTETQNTANDEHASGSVHLFNPSSTTFVKHFMTVFESISDNPSSVNNYCAGYFNTTSAIDAMQFKFASGNIDAGDICLYGLTT